MAKKKQNKQNGVLMLAIGAFIVITMFNMGFIGREISVNYDGGKDYFSVHITDYESEMEAGDTVTVNVEVENTKDDYGAMYVQCSIIDWDAQDWYTDVLMQTTLEYVLVEDCVSDEPFSQTGYLVLDELETEDLVFTLKVPDLVGKDNVILYCTSFEQCWATDKDPMTSSSVHKAVTIVVDDQDDDNNACEDPCTVDNDCAWMLGEECVNGCCVEVEEEDEDFFDMDLPSVDDSSIKAWAKDHQILLWGIGLIAMLLGAVMTFGGKQRNPYS